MISNDVVLGRGVNVFQPDLVNLCGCTIGDESRVGAFVEIRRGARTGARCKISSHTFICTGVTIEDEGFAGQGAMFIDDVYPAAAGELQDDAELQVAETLIGRRASLGSNSTIMGGVRVGQYAPVGADAVVTRGVPDRAIVAGARVSQVGDIRHGRGAVPGGEAG